MASNYNKKYFIWRGHSFDKSIFHEGLKQKKTMYQQTDNRMYMYTHTHTYIYIYI